jgi:hypothetical protein
MIATPMTMMIMLRWRKRNLDEENVARCREQGMNDRKTVSNVMYRRRTPNRYVLCRKRPAKTPGALTS